MTTPQPQPQMNIITDSQKFFLSSSGATVKKNGIFNSSMEFSIPTMYQKSDDLLYTTIRTLHAEIPYSFYIVNEYNNLLSITDKNNNIQNISIVEGNYNATSLATYLNTVLPGGMTLSFSAQSGKFTITYNHTFSINSTSTCYILLGFEKNTTYATSNSFTFPYLANLLGTKNIFLKFPNLILDNYNTQTGDRATLSNIPVDVPPYGLIMYENRSTSSTIIKNIQMPDVLYLQITSDTNDLIDFNAIDWSITIQIDFYLRKDFNQYSNF
jgi:hypothetical protein